MKGYATALAKGGDGAPYVALANDPESAFTLTNGHGVSSEEIRVGALPFPDGTVEVPTSEIENVKNFCNTCTFADWGSWYADNAVGPDGRNHAQAFGWWIAGDVVSGDDMPTKGAALYEGDAIGNVAKFESGAWLTYVATGDMSMTWNFANRKGNLHIKDFDGKNFNYNNMTATPGSAHFSGEGSGFSGSASGSFVKGSNFTPKTAPPGVIGNFNVDKNDYKATGIFGGAKVP